MKVYRLVMQLLWMILMLVWGYWWGYGAGAHDVLVWFR